MSYAERKTVAELEALYHFEPSVRDVFVEGSEDSRAFDWYLQQRVASTVSVVAIDAIDVPRSLVEKHGLDTGNRGRVLALAAEFDGRLKGWSRACPTLVYDADSDWVFGVPLSTEMLIPTDYTCFEMYLFDTAALDRVFLRVLRGCTYAPSQVLDALEKVLVRLWIIKMTNHALELSMSWISFETCCTSRGESIDFDEGEFIKRYLTSNSCYGEKDRFHRKVDEIALKRWGERRHRMDGHHFLILARWFFRHCGVDKRVLADARSFQRALYSCLEATELDLYPLFKRLVGRVSA